MRHACGYGGEFERFIIAANGFWRRIGQWAGHAATGGERRSGSVGAGTGRAGAGPGALRGSARGVVAPGAGQKVRIGLRPFFDF
jgi:hypothetical protein